MNKIIFLLSFSLFGTAAFAQFTEFGIAGGISNYQGDLSPAVDFKNINIGQTKGAFGILLRHNFNPVFGLRGALTYGQVAGDDRLTDNPFKQSRQLRFTSDIIEVSTVAEINLFGYDPMYSNKKFTPYLFIGAAGYYFNPKTDFNGRDIELQPLGTEGQGNPGFDAPYSRVAFAVPGGGGIKFNLGDIWTVGIEVGARKLFHDYLDDVSGTYAGYEILAAGPGGETAALVANRTHEGTDINPAAIPGGQTRGNANFNDWYYFSMATLTYHISNGNGRRGSNRGGMGCPKW